MNVISKMKKYYRDKKSAAFKLIDPGEPGKRLYFEGRKDYKDTLIKLLLTTVDRLQSLGVGVRVMIGDDVGYTYKTNKTDEAASCGPPFFVCCHVLACWLLGSGITGKPPHDKQRTP